MAFARERCQSIERDVPEPVEEVADRGEALQPNRVDRLTSIGLDLNEARGLEDLEVPRDGGAAYWEASCDFVHGQGPATQREEELTAKGIAQGVQRVCSSHGNAQVTI